MFNRSASDLGDAPRDLAALGSALRTAAVRLGRELEGKSLQRTAGQSRVGFRRTRLPSPQLGRPKPHRPALPSWPSGHRVPTTVPDRQRQLEERQSGGQSRAGVVPRLALAIRRLLLAPRLALQRLGRALGGSTR